MLVKLYLHTMLIVLCINDKNSMKPKQSVKGSTDLDEFDFDEYDEDEPEEETDSADTEPEDEEE